MTQHVWDAHFQSLATGLQVTCCWACHWGGPGTHLPELSWHPWGCLVCTEGSRDGPPRPVLGPDRARTGQGRKRPGAGSAPVSYEACTRSPALGGARAHRCSYHGAVLARDESAGSPGCPEQGWECGGFSLVRREMAWRLSLGRGLAPSPACPPRWLKSGHPDLLGNPGGHVVPCLVVTTHCGPVHMASGETGVAVALGWGKALPPNSRPGDISPTQGVHRARGASVILFSRR